LKQLLEQPGNVWQHPYLEGSQPYRTANSVSELVNQGVLQKDMASLFTPSSRPLYEHQEQALRAVIQLQQNIVVATGTGSGKTECFLIPMLDMLLKEGDNLSLAGVRAVILYPMNALVNDQVKRLRQLLCRQKTARIRFGFYTSRTEKEKKKALESLAAEFEAYEPEELRQLFTEAERESLNDERLIEQAIEKTSQVQLLSREEICEAPPHILITNYSMLEHMLIRPVERRKIFEASVDTFKMLVVDEAHTYDGSKGTEVSMLLERFKASVGVEQKGKIRCIATSASLGDKRVDQNVKDFAGELFGESFSQVIRGDRLTAEARLGKPDTLPAELTNEEILQYLSILELPEPDAPVSQWFDQLSAIVPAQPLEAAQSQADGDIHKFLWYALKQHPLVHRLINLLKREPQPWEQVVRSTELWGVNLPIKLDGSVDDTDAKLALAYLLQLGSLARENPEDLPLLPVRLHLLFRSLEGLHACINPDCSGAVRDPNHLERPLQYGRLYLNEKTTCNSCASPVMELGSCSQCGQAYAFTQRKDSGELQSLPRSTQGLRENTKIYTLTSSILDSVTEEEEVGEEEEEQKSEALKTFTIQFRRDGWIGIPSDKTFTSTATAEGEFYLAWHRYKQDDKNLDGCYLPKCVACSARPIHAQAINRFVAYTDAPLEAMIDSLFELLPEPEKTERNSSKRKLLTFSDGRQDAAFFASDYQRTHTEIVYRQMLWQAFQEVKDAVGVASVTQVIDKLKNKFLEISISHPDQDSRRNYLSYCPEDPESLENERDCQDSAEKRAKEILLREFALPFNRRSTLEAFALLTCHIQLDERLIDLVARQFGITKGEARIFLIVLTDIIRRTGIVSIEGASRYFPETGGVDGGRPEMVDAQGKSKNYLFLEKSEDEKKKFKNSPVFMPWKDGKVRQPPNRLGWYFLQLFGDKFPNREDFIWLFERLKEYRLLVPAKNGYQLNWKRLNIIETQPDWYQCNRCQQIFHVPELSSLLEINQRILKVERCPAYKCDGELKAYMAERIEQAANEHHQQYLIKKRSPLPLRSQEHTAQLGVGELEKRENRFRRGQINLLSCSTTLEMGIDIGELQAVVLRNFPPHVSNYQQRAGRAGRRTDGVAVTLMYGQRRPHDRFYFEQPEQLIAGSNQIPKLDSHNSQIQQRHIRAELLAEFLKIYSVGAEEVKIADFLSLPLDNYAATSDFNPSADSMVSQLREWLHGSTAQSKAQLWLHRLNSSATPKDLLNQFVIALSNFQDKQLEDWNGLVSLLREIHENIRTQTDRKKRDGQERRRNSLEAELDKIASRQLHEQLVQGNILPIYGFPIDVVRLLTGESNEYNSAQGRHRLQRDRRLALGEYAPDQKIVVDDRVYKSVGILKPAELEKTYYWVCKNCNNFIASDKQDDLVEICPVCCKEPSSPAAQKKKLYKVPKAFTTDWTQDPQVTPYIKPQRQPTSQIFLINDGHSSETLVSQLHLYTLNFSKDGNFFLANQGPLGNGKGFDKHGFAICNLCGRDLSILVREEWEKNSKSKKGRGKKSSSNSQPSRLTHKHPITGKECLGSYAFLHLGHEFHSDLLKIVFDQSTKPTPLFGSDVEYEDDGIIVTDAGNCNRGLEFWRSLTSALLAAAAQVIDVPRTELDALFAPRPDRLAEVIIYDNVPGGAGYSRRIAERFDEVLRAAEKIVSSCTCETSCYDCLQTYSNQLFHGQLDRCLVANFLRPIVEQVSPDEDLQNFAPHANRVSLSQIADNLPALCRMAGPDSLIYLPQLIDELGLNKGSTLPWLTLLTDAVYSMERTGKLLELIVSHIPEPNAVSDSDLGKRDHVKVWRKRLQQWIDQGLVKLYQVSADAESFPILCLSTKQTSRIALQLYQHLEDKSKSRVWFQTRSSEGVETVLSRLSELRDRARVVQPEELEDPDTIVVFLNPKDNEWRGDLSLPELRKKLEIERVLSGSKVTKVVYHDRYLRVAGAEILADLLQGDGLDSESQVLILTVEDRDARDASELSKKLTTVFTRLQPTKNKLKVHVKRWHERFDLPHGRDLEIYRQDGQEYKVIFDKGMAFLEARAGGTYRVTEPTYVVVTRQS
jgi:ATP-dependent helicase YprA (DUF1998 family)